MVPAQWWGERGGEKLDLLKVKEACRLVEVCRRTT